MADKIVLLDTSILIDFYRKTNKENSIWVSLIEDGYEFAISIITKYEIYNNVSQDQKQYWDDVLASVIMLPFDSATVDKAIDINSELKRKRKQIAIPDLFIAATAMANKLPISTLNKKHFERIEELAFV
jgi:predicted nucleic acid-binding protein